MRITKKRINKVFVDTVKKDLKSLGIDSGRYQFKIVKDRKEFQKEAVPLAMNLIILRRERLKEREFSSKEIEKALIDSKKAIALKGEKRKDFLSTLPEWEKEAIELCIKISSERIRNPKPKIMTNIPINPPTQSLIYLPVKGGITGAKAEAGHFVYNIIRSKSRVEPNLFLSELFDGIYQYEAYKRFPEGWLRKTFDKNILSKTKDPKIMKQALFNVARMRFKKDEKERVIKALKVELDRILSVKKH